MVTLAWTTEIFFHFFFTFSERAKGKGRRMWLKRANQKEGREFLFMNLCVSTVVALSLLGFLQPPLYLLCQSQSSFHLHYDIIISGGSRVDCLHTLLKEKKKERTKKKRKNDLRRNLNAETKRGMGIGIKNIIIIIFKNVI